MRRLNTNIYNCLIERGIDATPELIDKEIRQWGENEDYIICHYNSYLAHIRHSGAFGPIEKHPYIDLYKTECNYNRNKMLLGTFPPSTYFNNLKLENLDNNNLQNKIPLHFYYGNTNSLWDYLFSTKDIEINVQIIKDHLANCDISISDVYSFIQRKKLINPSDANIYNIVLNQDLKNIFTKESGVQTLLFTSGKLSSFLQNNVSALTGFRWIMEEYCGGLKEYAICGELSGEGEYFMIDKEGIKKAVDQQKEGICWWIKSKMKKLRIVNLPSPSPQASVRMIKSPFFIRWLDYKVRKNDFPTRAHGQAVKDYLSINHEMLLESVTKQFRREVYQMALTDTLCKII